MSDNAILANSIWPNGIKVDADGHAVFYPLGTNKIEVPSEDEWPKGDTLVSPFVYEDGLLVGFVDTKAMIVSGNTSITLPYEHIEADFSSILQGDLTVNAPNAEYKNFIWAVVAGEGGAGGGVEINFKYKGCKNYADVKAKDANYLSTDIVNGVWTESLADLENGTYMFSEYNPQSYSPEAKNLTTFKGDLSSLTDGTSMFYYCHNLTTFESDLSALLNGREMFNYCSGLTTFDRDLSSLTNSYQMFKYCSGLTTFESDMSSLTNGQWMFQGCSNLTSFTGDLSSLTNGYGMFQGCYDLTSFTGDLSSLTNGYHMFQGCDLDTASIQHIASTINDVTDLTSGDYVSSAVYKYLYIGTSTPLDSAKRAALEAIEAKGWIVGVNGAPLVCALSTMTLDENGEETVVPIPFYAKPIPSDEEHARYVDAEGNYYDIFGAQYIFGDDLSTYGMFTSEEDAAANMRLTKIGQEEIETA